MSPEIKWRGSLYMFEREESGRVYWFNPYSKHRSSCSVESWANGIPYEDM